MTEIQFLAHQDQMDAMRRDFLARWKRERLPTLGDKTTREKAALMDAAWREERKGALSGLLAFRDSLL
jgi:hypothetical protein